MKCGALFWSAISTSALGLALFVNLPVKLVYNPSPSAPVGFYGVDKRPVKRGDYVLLRVPENVRDLVETRAYLPRDVPLIKRVAGKNGDKICRFGDVISINGKPVALAKPHDNSGRTLPTWNGCRFLNEDQIFLLQDHEDSFDGRYFGPVDRRLVIGRATKLELFRRRYDGDGSSAGKRFWRRRGSGRRRAR